MSLVKKMISCGLALSLALGGIAGVSRVSAENGSLTTGQKIVGGVSAVGGIGLLAGIGIGTWHHYHNLPVLIIGGDNAARTALIDKLKNRASVTVRDREHETLTSAIEKITAEGVKYDQKLENHVKGTGKTRAEFKNWNIKHCDASDAKAADLMKKARLVIVLIKNSNDASTIHQLISRNVKRNSCVIARVVDRGLFQSLISQDLNYVALGDIGFAWNSVDDSLIMSFCRH